jgi:hypothetical protein
MPTTNPPRLLIVGPPQHGVVGYATDLADAVATTLGRTPAELPFDAARTHVHVTDRILGATPEEAADGIERLASTTRLSITLHDVPQESDGTGFSRRIDAYRRFLAAARGVAVNSRHEAALVLEHLGHRVDDAAVVPIGTRTGHPAPRPRAAAGARGNTVMIGGYIYPGKGHLEAIRAAGDAGRALGGERPTVVAIGSPSAGHERDVDELTRVARGEGVDFRVTGYLDDDAYSREQYAHGVPVAAHQHVSASRSILDWVETGRRALVVESRYSREMAALRPGTITLFPPRDLSEHIQRAWREPESTWLAPSTVLAPTLEDAALAYRHWWATL